MAKPTKAAEFRSLSEEEIEKEIYDCQSSLFFARIAQKQRKVRSHLTSYQCMPVCLKPLCCACSIGIKVLSQIVAEQRMLGNVCGYSIVPLHG